MRILSIDSSAGSSVALVDIENGVTTTLAAASNSDTRAHAENLTPLVGQVCAEAGVKVMHAGIEAVVVGTGPAPFTGLRAGLMSAKILAKALAVPLVGVCSMDAIGRVGADVLARNGSDQQDGEILVVTDARRREVHVATYRALGRWDVQVTQSPMVASPLQAGEQAAGKSLVCGDGTGKYVGAPQASDGIEIGVDPVILARIGYERLIRVRAGEQVAIGTEPMYLRRPDINTSTGRKRATN